MKIIKLDLKRRELELIPEDFEDLYFLHMFVKRGDHVRSWTVRHIKRLKGDSARPERGERVRVMIEIEVKETELEGLRGALRIKGVIREAPDWLPAKGKHHTIIVRPGHRLHLRKTRILDFEIRRLERLSSGKRRRILIVAMDYDEATIALLHEVGVDILERRAVSLPSKLDEKGRRSTIARFFSEMAARILELVKREDVKHIVVAGPGIAKREFYAYLSSRLQDVNIMVEDATSGDVSGVYEVIRRGVERRILRECEIVEAQRAIEDALAYLGKGVPKVALGIEEVLKASTMGAIEILVIGERLMRDPSLQDSLAEVIENTERYRGKILILSSKAELYPTLRSFGGILALLRFPIELKAS